MKSADHQPLTLPSSREKGKDRSRWARTIIDGLMFSLLLVASAHAAESRGYECRWTDEAIVIDGKADESAWGKATVIKNFRLAWLGKEERPPLTKTSARLLWDREYLYFYAEMEDVDVYADIKEPDGQLWDNDVFELFFKPATNKTGYYEFQVNAATQRWICFCPHEALAVIHDSRRMGSFTSRRP